MDGLIDPSKIRIHFAARSIAFYISQGKTKYFLAPFIENPIFNNLWGQEIYVHPAGYKDVAENMLRFWPEETLEFFFPYPVIRLLKRHSQDEQTGIFRVLKAYYGYIW